MIQLGQAILKTLAYADVFDYPLLSEEIRKYLISPVRIPASAIKKDLTLLVQKRLVGEKDGLYYLRGRKAIVSLRKKRLEFSRKKIAIAQKAARFLKLIPGVKAILITGSLACLNAKQEDDIDWLIITGPESLWLTRILAVLFLQLLGKRRLPGQAYVSDKICLNVFLSQDCLALPVEERDLFAAHEIFQAKVLWQRKNVYRKFIEANLWANRFLANGASFRGNSPSGDEAKKKQKQIRLDALLFPLEKIAFWFQLAYMRPKRGSEKIEPKRALFHPEDVRDWLKKKYRRRLISLGISDWREYDILILR
ncbi:MAG: hypothetical protein JW991_03455 [Candidatus Pacebacteria bacterium]|nr:hypothetical protein [Candidatus Paceibacterota bacterium]